MPEIYIDVDTAVTVPVNLIPLIDDTDFKTREVAITYDQAGMDLVWNFQTTAGVTTQTPVTPTTAGVYDWTHSGDGMYKIEIPASGGGSINNDTEGFGWFSGICTGVLAWRGPVMGFRAAALNNALIDGGDVLDVNMTEISGDTGAADNIEATYDGTGYTEDSAPAKQSQLASLSNVGSAVHRPAASYTLTTGTQSANTFAATEALDELRHEHTGATAMDLYYEFNIGAGTPSSVQVTGYITGNNDDLDVYGYDWVAAAWVQIGNIQGSNSTVNQVNSFDMFVDMVGSGVNSGVVRIRFFKTSGLTTALLAIDQIFVAFNQGVISSLDAVYFDSNASNTGTTGTDGVPGNPVSSEAAVNTLLAARNLSKVVVTVGSSITFSTDHTGEVWSGHNWTLAFGGQDISGSHFFGALTSGIGTGTSEIDFHDCIFNACTLDPFHMIGCGFNEVTITIGKAGTYIIHQSHSTVAGVNTPKIDTGAAIGNVSLSISDYANGIEIENLNATGSDKFSISGKGQIIYAASCSGTVHQRGDWKVTNTGGVVITEDDNTSSITVIETDTADMQPKLGTPAGASISADLVVIDNFVDGIETAVITNAAGTDIAADIIAIKAETVLIVEDTGELQTNQGNWLTATGFATSGALGTHDGKLDLAQLDLDTITGSDGVTLATAQGNYAPLKGGAAMTEGYAADGSTATPEQILYMIWATVSEFAISGTTITAKKLDNSTTAMTFTLDDGTNPTSRTRAT